MSPWLRALPFWAHPLLLHPSWLAVLRWCWRKIWSLNLPRLFLSGRLCSYCLFLHAKHFPYLCSPEFILAFRSLALISPSQEALLTSNMRMLPTCPSSAHQPGPLKTRFLAFVTNWNQPTINQSFYSSSFLPIASLSSIPIEWKKNLRLCYSLCIFST